MARQTVQIAGQPVTLAESDPLPMRLSWWAVLRTRVIDEMTGLPPRAQIRVSSSTPHCLPRVGEWGLCGLVARPADVSWALVSPARLRATIEVEGYIPLVLDEAIDAARRVLPTGAAFGATTLEVEPPDSNPRSQFLPGRGIVIERDSPSGDEQFTQQADTSIAPAANEVPLADLVQPGRGPGCHVAGLPLVLDDLYLHVAEPVRIAGRARRQVLEDAAAVPAPAARIGISGVWWANAEIQPNSAPPHPPRVVSFFAPLSLDHADGEPAWLCDLIPDGLRRFLAEPARAGDRFVQVHPWLGLNPAGGDVLRFEDDPSPERELLISDGFDASINAARPARIRLRGPLSFPHPASALVMGMGLADEPPPQTRALERRAIPGDRVLFLNSVDNLPTEPVLRIAAGTSREELRFARCLPSYGGGGFAHEVRLAGDGAFELPPLARIAQLRLRVEHGYDPLSEPPPQPLDIDFAPDYRGGNLLSILIRP